jgi:hypothetical protein
MIDLARHIEKNKDIAIALDGPRGPRGVVKPGALWLSKATSCAIVPMGIAFGRAKRFGSWDRLALPMPFSRVVMVIGDNVQIGPDAGDDVIQRARVDLEKSMTRLQADAQKCLEPTIFRTLEKPKGVAWTWDRYRQRIGHSA